MLHRQKVVLFYIICNDLLYITNHLRNLISGTREIAPKD